MSKTISIQQEKIVTLEKIEDEIASANIRLETVNAEIEASKAKLTDVNGIVAESQATLSGINDSIEQTKGALDDLQSDYMARKALKDEEFRDVLLKTKDAVVRLKNIQEEEDSIRKAIALERQLLDKERRTVNALKAKLGGAESRVKKLDSLIKL